ncbi:MAG: MetQ/NlpA family ABC transporter substrate-binding protein [Sutterella parvirubra]|uniref:Lipoprotein n=1 Tax=Sutterella parvirubra YIT 11816 TaxID=762967 RepID=H3KGN8_9BURK|nr:MetQ/NlpA family ABC transporter substrate-binding protein [Sutterella parvirubra]EHY30724.1 NLPA lipoprotein [Sutterella parvirubra YIT 11816]MCI7709098.1 MetQ/NlpA family ABC transporter substrate-binding protein [Sutterella parvirubra]MDR3770450.1 MetQ/NlpA family ABC transporter substrate-binding protein [Sutterella sp.]MDY5200671.1 MetQ/NlpA family ABC transporter substrate-binding protein [Sutterella parvirubra]
MKFTRLFSSVAVAAGLALSLAGCQDKAPEAPAAGAAPKAAVLTIGVSPVPHADIVNFVAPTLKNQGIEVKVVEFSDYVQPNLSLADKELDANFFQHKPYLDEFAESRGLKLESLVAVHIEPMGVYSKSVKKVEDLAEGAKIAIPNDPTNGGRALKVLETAGLIKLKADAGILATPNDIVENPKKLSFLEIEAAQLPRALDDVAAAVINSNFALGANLNPTKDAIAIESKDSPYANIVAIRAGESNREDLQKLKAVLTSPEVKKFLEDKFQGSVVPAF